jgi:hypothetical protein
MVVSDFKYVEKLCLDWDAYNRPNLFRVKVHWTVSFCLDGEELLYTVGAGRYTDLASIPAIVPKWVAKKVDMFLGAAVVHDDLCELKLWTSKVAADVYEEGMKAAENLLPRETIRQRLYLKRMGIKRRLMVRAVRMFGPSWE